MKTHSPYILLIAGPSASGKSTLAKHLATSIVSKGFSQTVVALDNYYRDLSHLPIAQRAKIDFDHPDAWEHERILHDILKIKNGQSVEIPTYDYQNHTRANATQRIEITDYFIFEGLFALCYAELCALADLRVYVNLEDAIALERRIQRDTQERGRTRDSVIQQFRTTVQQANKKYIYPSKAAADIIVAGNTSTTTQIDLILDRLFSHRNQNQHDETI